MYTITVILRKRPEISVTEFRRIWKEVYGPFYAKMPQVKSYVQYHLADRKTDLSEDSIEGVAILSFESKNAMREAWKSDIYKEAAKIRNTFVRETTIGVHVAAVEEKVVIV